MATNWMRRTFLTASVCAAAALTAACGSSSTANSVNPTSLVVFGDATADIGQNVNGRAYSVTGSTIAINNWTQKVADRYGLKISTAKSGGTSYAQGNARVAEADATGVTSAPSVTAQITTWLATNPAFSKEQFVLISAGQSDIIAGWNQVAAGTITADQFNTNMTAAGTLLGEQVVRLNKAGATHIFVMGAPELAQTDSPSKNYHYTPWATALNAASTATGSARPSAVITAGVSAFNKGLFTAVKNLEGTSVLLMDLQTKTRALLGYPSSYGFTEKYNNTPICASKSATNSMNIGTDKVDSSLCTTSTLLSGLGKDDVDDYLFADMINYSPEAHVLIGNWAYNLINDNW